MQPVNRTKELRRTAIFSDIHWGRRGNSEEHNADCAGFIQWFCQQVKQDPKIDSIAFLGDWFQTRNSVHLATLYHAHEGAKMLNALGLPVHVITGNHDLLTAHNRLVSSTHSYEMFPNFHIVKEPLIVPNMGNGTMFSPYLFEHEYTDILDKYHKQKTWMGHFEFKDFVLTGQNMVLASGPDHRAFRSQSTILSGHFHKRQAKDNVCYIGNTFPMDYSDTGDLDRGMTVFDHDKNTLEFTAWPNQPRYTRVVLSALMDMKGIDHLLVDKNRIQCLVDVKISYEEMMMLKEEFQTKVFKGVDIREFTLEESDELRSAVAAGINASVAADTVKPINERIVDLLSTLKVDKIDNSKLISIFQSVSSSK